jgi:hypothetical protein
VSAAEVPESGENRSAAQRAEELFRRRVVAERRAQVREAVDVSRTEHEASAQLEGVLSESMLAVAGVAGARPGPEVGSVEEMRDRGTPQASSPVRDARLVDEKRKIDARLLLEGARVVAIAEADGGEPRARRAERPLVRAQLRGVLAAEDSAVVAKKHDHRRPRLPHRAEPDPVARDVR